MEKNSCFFQKKIIRFFKHFSTSLEHDSHFLESMSVDKTLILIVMIFFAVFSGKVF